MGYSIFCFENVMSTLKGKISEVAIKKMTVPVADTMRHNVIGGNHGSCNTRKTFNYGEVSKLVPDTTRFGKNFPEGFRALFELFEEVP